MRPREAAMGPRQVIAYAGERLGMEIQAVSLLCARPAGSRRPEVWEVLTEHGYFWLVEAAGAAELFRATQEGGRSSALLAIRRFRELHPEERGPCDPDRGSATPVQLRRREVVPAARGVPSHS